MSSILKALKKLEQDHPPKKYPRIWVRNEDMTRGVRAWLVGGVAAVLLIIGGAAAYFALGIRATDTVPDPSADQVITDERSPLRSGTLTQARADQKPAGHIEPEVHAKQPNQAKQHERSTPAKERRPVDLRRRSVPIADTPVSALSSPADPERPKTSSDQKRTTAKTRPLIKDQARVSQEKSHPEIITKTNQTPFDQQPADDRGANAIGSQALPATLLTESSLKIQAISWSETPANRIAVVNSQIVRQGESIDGYRIEQINSDDLILSKGGINWVLKFVHQ